MTTPEQRMMLLAVMAIQQMLRKLDVFVRALKREYNLEGTTTEDIIQELEEKIRE